MSANGIKQIIIMGC